MKKLVVLLLCAAVPALADPPADAPLADVPNTSVRLTKGTAAPFDGYLVSDAETMRRGKKEANENGTLTDAEQNGMLLPKAAVAALIAGAAAAIAAAISLGVCAEQNCLKK